METQDMKQLIESVKVMAEAASAARRPEVLGIPNLPQGLVPLFFPANGTVQWTVVGPGPRRYVAHDLADLARMIDEFAARPAAEFRAGPTLASSVVDDLARMIDELAARPAAEFRAGPTLASSVVDGVAGDEVVTFVLVSSGKVRVVIDEKGLRRDMVQMEFAEHDGWKALKSIDGKWLDQGQMIDALRTDIAATYVPGIVGLLREIKWKGGDTGEAVRVTGKASLGRQIEMAVESASGKLPEDLAITIPLFDDLLGEDGFSELFGVSASFDVDVTERKFRVKLKAGEVARTELAADTMIQQRLAARLTRKNVWIYRASIG